MRIFELPEFPDKINFVDHNNVVVGFDMRSSCCEDFGYFFALTPEGETIEGTDVEYLEPFDFDPDWHKQVESDQDSDGGYAIFRLVDAAGAELYLHLYNHHNGYYSHGFSLDVGGISRIEGSL